MTHRCAASVGSVSSGKQRSGQQRSGQLRKSGGGLLTWKRGKGSRWRGVNGACACACIDGTHAGVGLCVQKLACHIACSPARMHTMHTSVHASRRAAEEQAAAEAAAAAAEQEEEERLARQQLAGEQVDTEAESAAEDGEAQVDRGAPEPLLEFDPDRFKRTTVRTLREKTVTQAARASRRSAARSAGISNSRNGSFNGSAPAADTLDGSPMGACSRVTAALPANQGYQAAAAADVTQQQTREEDAAFDSALFQALLAEANRHSATVAPAPQADSACNDQQRPAGVESESAEAFLRETDRALARVWGDMCELELESSWVGAGAGFQWQVLDSLVASEQDQGLELSYLQEQFSSPVVVQEPPGRNKVKYQLPTTALRGEAAQTATHAATWHAMHQERRLESADRSHAQRIADRREAFAELKAHSLRRAERNQRRKTRQNAQAAAEAEPPPQEKPGRRGVRADAAASGKSKEPRKVRK